MSIKSNLMKLVPDRIFVPMIFRIKVVKSLNLKTPKTFTDKLNWLKLYYHDPAYTRMVG